LVAVPSGVIIAWTIWLTRAIISRNNKLAEARRAAESADRAKSEFLANISHELRTPLHGILSYAKFGLDDTADDETSDLHQFFSNVDHCAANLLHLVNDLLDLSKLEAGRMHFEFQSVEVGTLFKMVIDEFKSFCTDRGVIIGYKRPAEPIWAVVAPDKLQQVLINLLSNAAKFSPPNGIILVQLRREDDKFILGISDEGPGIPENELEAVFDKFVQSSKTKSHNGGTGLGLAICRQIVAGHDGRIWVKNNARRGCTFFIEVSAVSSHPMPDDAEADLVAI
jgi:signal transduction histidine kinase